MSNTIPLPESLTSDQEKALLAEAKTGPFRHTTPSYGNDMQSGETPRLSSKRHAGSTPPTAPAPVVLLPEPDCRLPMDGPPRYRADQMHAHAAAVSAAKDAEIAGLRAELLKSLADNAALRERGRVLEDAHPEPDCRTCKRAAIQHGVTRCTSPYFCTNGDRYEPLPPVRLWRTT